MSCWRAGFVLLIDLILYWYLIWLSRDFPKRYLLQLAVVKMDILHLCQAIKLVSDVPWSSSKSDTRQRVNSPGRCWALAGSKSESKPIIQTGDDSGICWQQLHVVTLSTSNLIININAIQANRGWSIAAVGSNTLGRKRNRNSHNKDLVCLEEGYGGSSLVLKHCPSLTFAILVHRWPKSYMCVGIGFTSFQDSQSLFWSIGKLICSSVLLLLPFFSYFSSALFPCQTWWCG